ncbi:hypothetical protein PHK61_14160 [Actinomycetospora lutea]|uniref:hypothetical protein n=1 Tax=Actinomycetospora lutea TaxID=663604 RepID=UPI002365EF0D|nr:hypothetical protein [Actinomycetospora lutea]MDD7939563.1 hypothetical protein [Actinomycetospora lutea]
MDQGDARSDQVAGRYRLGRLLTADRRRRVHEGWDTRLLRTVAVVLVAPAAGTDPDPTLPPSPVTPVHLHRPGLVELYDGGVHGDEVFLICQRIPGPTLATVLARPWTVVQLADLVHRLARTLEPVHRSGAAHGALTPDRILLGGARPMIAECGVAALVERWSGLPDDTHYRAPEQSAGETGPPADVFALGRILLEARRRAIAPGARDLRVLAARMTATDPAARPDVREVATVLAACRDRAAGDPAVRARRTGHPTRVLAATATAAGLVLGGSAALGAVAPVLGGGSALVAPPEPALRDPGPMLTHGRLPTAAAPVIPAADDASPVGGPTRTGTARTGERTARTGNGRPTSAEPASAVPARIELTPGPTTARPTTARPTTARPTTARPTTARPTTARPTTDRPTTARTTTARPRTAPTTAPTTAPRAARAERPVRPPAAPRGTGTGATTTTSRAPRPDSAPSTDRTTGRPGSPTTGPTTSRTSAPPPGGATTDAR